MSIILVNSSNAEISAPTNESDFIQMEITHGPVIIKLKPNRAPKHVARIKELTKQGFYNGVVFHRVIDGFMAQTGDPTGTGMGGSGQKLPAEFNIEKHVKGTVSMARAMDPNSADSQFFICFNDAPHLDGNYTVFGEVISGMEFVDKIKKGSPQNNGTVENPDKIISFKLLSQEEAKKYSK
ncbi:MAG: peptidylprolyl isomerase [Rickettsiaceae bacterium]|nr:peptidylprolyl isomerase [Rickettsiaceae bacterium]